MELEKRTIGRAGLEVTILGLGSGGNSRLGLSTGLDEDHAVEVVQSALDQGINLVDTARVYGTEKAVGRALSGRPRENFVLSSKSPYLDEEKHLLSPSAFQANLEASLSDLGLERIDIYFIHGLRVANYPNVYEQLFPILERAKRKGQIGAIGVTEAFEADTHHEMLQIAVQDEWDVVMVGFNILNQTARERVLQATKEKGMGTMGMFAVRKGLIDETYLRVLLKRLAESGEIDPNLAAEPDLMQALRLRGICNSLSEAAYRFAAFEPGMDCILAGTSNPQHFKENIAAVQCGPLPAETVQHLRKLFGKVESISGQVR